MTKQIEAKFLEELVKDCITYRLSEKEALQYVEFRFKRISEASYKLKKARILSDKSTQLWLNDFSRTGFVQHHKKQLEDIQKIQDDSLKEFFKESQKEQRDASKIKFLKYDIRQNAKLLSEFGLGTPIISTIKARLDAKRISAQ